MDNGGESESVYKRREPKIFGIRTGKQILTTNFNKINNCRDYFKNIIIIQVGILFSSYFYIGQKNRLLTWYKSIPLFDHR